MTCGSPGAVDREAFDALVTAGDTPMVVITAANGEERSGCLVGFHTQSSIDPRRYAIWLSKANHTYRVALGSPFLAVHYLAEGHHDLARLFGGETGDEIDKFARVTWEPGPDGVPLLSDCTTRIIVRQVEVIDLGGDHVCIETDPVSATASEDFRPLRFSDVRDVDAGHSP